MKSYNALIVEDVKDTSDYILQRINALCPILKDVQQALTLQIAEEMIYNNHYDIVFLDIQMPMGTSFDLLKRLAEQDKINFEIIFITGESAKEYTLKAIKFSAIDFLYKPLDDSELVIAVNRAVNRLQNQNYNHQINLLLQRIDSKSNIKSNKIAFHLYKGVTQMVDISELMYLQADGVVSKVYLKNGEKLTTNQNLGYYKEILTSEYGFLPLSNSILANKDYIKRYNHQMLNVTLTDGTELHVSRRRGKEIRDLLHSKTFNFSSILRIFSK